MTDRSGQKRPAGTESASGAAKRTRVEPLQNDQLCVDWGILAEGRWGQRKPLPKRMSLQNIDEAVGWATHVEGAERPTFPLLNPLASLDSSPPRPSLLGFINNKVSKLLIDSEQNSLWESFDDSSLVALGMVWEEMLTASLLPFAEEHVQRCRRLGQDDNNAAFDEWTLPPDEAILKLSRFAPRTFTGGLPTARPLTRTCHNENTSVVEDVKLWCNSHGISLDTAQKAWHIYKLFLPKEHEKLGQVPKLRRKLSNGSQKSKKAEAPVKED